MVEIKGLNFDFSDEILREHNQTVYKKVMYSLMKGQKTLFEQATGTGKSYVACKLLKDFGAGERALFVCPSEAIQTQFKNDFEEWVVGKGTTTCQFDTCLYQGLNRVKANQYDIIIFDEVHRMGAKTWGPNSQELMTNNPNALIVGMTATLQRPDGIDVTQYFDGNKPVSSLPLPTVLEKGILPCPDYVLAKVNFDDDKEFVESSLKDFKQRLKKAETQEEKAEIQEKIDMLQQARKEIPNSKDIPDIFASEMTDEMKTGKFIVFCPQGTDEDDDTTESISRMNQIMKQSKDWFSKTDGVRKVKRYSVYSGRDGKINEHVIKAFEEDDSKALKLLFSVNMLNEGLHVKGIDGVIMLRPTSSHIIYLQQMGRALAVGGNNPKIFDFVANLDSVGVNDIENLAITINKGKDIDKGGNGNNSNGNTGKGDDFKYKDTRFNLKTYNYDEIQLIEQLRKNIYEDDNVSFEDKAKEYLDFIEKNGRKPNYSNTGSDEERTMATWMYSVTKYIKRCGGIEKYEEKFPGRSEILTQIGFDLTELTAEALSQEKDLFKDKAEEYGRFIEAGGNPNQLKTATDEERAMAMWEQSVTQKIKKCGGIENYEEKFPGRIEILTQNGFDLTSLTTEALSREKDPFKDKAEEYGRFIEENDRNPKISKTATDKETTMATWAKSIVHYIKQCGGIENYEEKFPGRSEILTRIGFDLTNLTADALSQKGTNSFEEKVKEYGRFIEAGGNPNQSKTATNEELAMSVWAKSIVHFIKKCGGIENYEEKFPGRSELLTRIGFDLTNLTAEALSQEKDPFKDKAEEYGRFIEAGGNPNKLKTASELEKEMCRWKESVITVIKRNGGIENYEEKFPGRSEILAQIGFDLTELTAEALSQEKDPFKDKVEEYGRFIEAGGNPNQSKTATNEELAMAVWANSVKQKIKQCGGIEKYEEKFPGRSELLTRIGFDLTSLTTEALSQEKNPTEDSTEQLEEYLQQERNENSDNIQYSSSEDEQGSNGDSPTESTQQNKLTVEEIIAKLNKSAPKDTDEGAPPPVG